MGCFVWGITLSYNGASPSYGDSLNSKLFHFSSQTSGLGSEVGWDGPFTVQSFKPDTPCLLCIAFLNRSGCIIVKLRLVCLLQHFQLIGIMFCFITCHDQIITIGPLMGCLVWGITLSYMGKSLMRWSFKYQSIIIFKPNKWVRFRGRMGRSI
jgi:hypothetical protein